MDSASAECSSACSQGRLVFAVLQWGSLYGWSSLSFKLSWGTVIHQKFAAYIFLLPPFVPWLEIRYYLAYADIETLSTSTLNCTSQLPHKVSIWPLNPTPSLDTSTAKSFVASLDIISSEIYISPPLPPSTSRHVISHPLPRPTPLAYPRTTEYTSRHAIAHGKRDAPPESCLWILYLCTELWL